MARSAGLSILKDVAGLLAPGVGIGKRRGARRSGKLSSFDGSDIARRPGGKTGNIHYSAKKSTL